MVRRQRQERQCWAKLAFASSWANRRGTLAQWHTVPTMKQISKTRQTTKLGLVSRSKR